MESVQALAVLGVHAIVDDGRADCGWFDAVDLLLSDGTTAVVFGLRTRDYIVDARAHGDPPWEDHRPLAITLDPKAVPFWDFEDVMWIGPANHACLAWSNAEALSIRALHTLFTLPTRKRRLLRGPEGKGLPSPDDLGLRIPSDLMWERVQLTD